MFEKRLKELSRKIGEDELKTFYILTHRKHNREIYFTGSRESLVFMKPKFVLGKGRIKKSLAYLLLKLKILHLFLKKIKLTKKFEDVIFVGEKINCFNLSKKEVLSLPSHKDKEKEFIESKKFQQKVAKKGFAPKIFEMNKKIPYSREEMVYAYEGKNIQNIFKKLIMFYKLIGIKRIPVKKYVLDLKKGLKEQRVKDSFLLNELNKISNKKFKILMTTLHGDFAKENTLIDKNEKIVFTDWHPYKGLITNSIINYFRLTENVQSNPCFKEVINVFPKEVRNNLKEYLILSEIDLVVKKNKDVSVAIKKIKKHLYF